MSITDFNDIVLDVLKISSEHYYIFTLSQTAQTNILNVRNLLLSCRRPTNMFKAESFELPLKVLYFVQREFCWIMELRTSGHVWTGCSNLHPICSQSVASASQNWPVWLEVEFVDPSIKFQIIFFSLFNISISIGSDHISLYLPVQTTRQV